jgi:hypothetical protein
MKLIVKVLCTKMRQTNLQFTKLVVVNKVDSTQHSLKISTPAAHKNVFTLPKSTLEKLPLPDAIREEVFFWRVGACNWVWVCDVMRIYSKCALHHRFY